eukprot:ANDGO_05441.mRNA.1 hypothetical protein
MSDIGFVDNAGWERQPGSQPANAVIGNSQPLQVSQQPSSAGPRSSTHPLTCEGPHAVWLQKLRASSSGPVYPLSSTLLDAVPRDIGKLRFGYPELFSSDSVWRKAPADKLLKDPKGWSMIPPVRVSERQPLFDRQTILTKVKCSLHDLAGHFSDFRKEKLSADRKGSFNAALSVVACKAFSISLAPSFNNGQYLVNGMPFSEAVGISMMSDAVVRRLMEGFAYFFRPDLVKPLESHLFSEARRLIDMFILHRVPPGRVLLSSEIIFKTWDQNLKTSKSFFGHDGWIRFFIEKLLSLCFADTSKRALRTDFNWKEVVMYLYVLQILQYFCEKGFLRPQRLLREIGFDVILNLLRETFVKEQVSLPSSYVCYLAILCNLLHTFFSGSGKLSVLLMTSLWIDRSVSVEAVLSKAIERESSRSFFGRSDLVGQAADVHASFLRILKSVLSIMAPSAGASRDAGVSLVCRRRMDESALYRCLFLVRKNPSLCLHLGKTGFHQLISIPPEFWLSKDVVDVPPRCILAPFPLSLDIFQRPSYSGQVVGPSGASQPFNEEVFRHFLAVMWSFCGEWSRSIVDYVFSKELGTRDSFVHRGIVYSLLSALNRSLNQMLQRTDLLKSLLSRVTSVRSRIRSSFETAILNQLLNGADSVFLLSSQTFSHVRTYSLFIADLMRLDLFSLRRFMKLVMSAVNSGLSDKQKAVLSFLLISVPNDVPDVRFDLNSSGFSFEGGSAPRAVVSLKRPSSKIEIPSKRPAVAGMDSKPRQVVDRGIWHDPEPSPLVGNRASGAFSRQSSVDDRKRFLSLLLVSAIQESYSSVAAFWNSKNSFLSRGESEWFRELGFGELLSELSIKPVEKSSSTEAFIIPSSRGMSRTDGALRTGPDPVLKDVQFDVELCLQMYRSLAPFCVQGDTPPFLVLRILKLFENWGLITQLCDVLSTLLNSPRAQTAVLREIFEYFEYVISSIMGVSVPISDVSKFSVSAEYRSILGGKEFSVRNWVGGILNCCLSNNDANSLSLACSAITYTISNAESFGHSLFSLNLWKDLLFELAEKSQEQVARDALCALLRSSIFSNIWQVDYQELSDLLTERVSHVQQCIRENPEGNSATASLFFLSAVVVSVVPTSVAAVEKSNLVFVSPNVAVQILELTSQVYSPIVSRVLAVYLELFVTLNQGNSGFRKELVRIFGTVNEEKARRICVSSFRYLPSSTLVFQWFLEEFQSAELHADVLMCSHVFSIVTDAFGSFIDGDFRFSAKAKDHISRRWKALIQIVDAVPLLLFKFVSSSEQMSSLDVQEALLSHLYSVSACIGLVKDLGETADTNVRAESVAKVIHTGAAGAGFVSLILEEWKGVSALSDKWWYMLKLTCVYFWLLGEFHALLSVSGTFARLGEIWDLTISLIYLFSGTSAYGMDILVSSKSQKEHIVAGDAMSCFARCVDVALLPPELITAFSFSHSEDRSRLDLDCRLVGLPCKTCGHCHGKSAINPFQRYFTEKRGTAGALDSLAITDPKVFSRSTTATSFFSMSMDVEDAEDITGLSWN